MREVWNVKPPREIWVNIWKTRLGETLYRASDTSDEADHVASIGTKDIEGSPFRYVLAPQPKKKAKAK